MLTTWFHDVRVRHGIKVGIAALLALWITQLLHLEHPNWSILGVLVLSNTYYVGAVASRALMRSLGTLCGALLGIWAIGDFGNDPARFVVIVFVTVTLATYYFGQLASSAWPYAYYLVGLTLTAVATYGIADPANVWRSALQRVLETLVAVFCATFISAVVWPRHASEEFAAAAAEALRAGRTSLLARVRPTRADGSAVAERVRFDAALDDQILRLRSLIVTGGRGSIRFRARLGNLQRFLVALTHLRHAGLELENFPAWNVGAERSQHSEIDGITSALDQDLAALAEMVLSDHGSEPGRVSAAYDSLEKSFHRLVAERWSRGASLARCEAIFGYLAAWRQIRDELQTVHDTLGGQSRQRPPPGGQGSRGFRWLVLDGQWVRISVKAGVSVCLAFLLLRWVHPPGANAVPVAALLCSAGSRYSLVAGGRGDLRVLQTAFLTFLLGFPVVGMCWLLLPMLTNYWAMNAVLFALCFGLSFTMARLPLFTYGRLLGILSISTLVALNPNQVVRFATLMDAYLGLMVGIGLGVLVGRVLWPVLPQGLLRGHMVQFFGNLRQRLAGPTDDTYIFSQAATLPVEAMQAIRQMALPGCPPDERQRLIEFVQTVQPLGLQIATLKTAINEAEAKAGLGILRMPLQELTTDIDQFLAGLARRIRSGGQREEFPDLDRCLGKLESAWLRLQDDAPLEMEQISVALGLLNRCRAVNARLQAGGERLGALRLSCYLGDVAL